MEPKPPEPWDPSVQWDPQLLKHTPPPQTTTYHVPERFGLDAILALMTIMSFVFVLLRWTDAPAFMFVVLALLVLLICLAQMRWGDVPRASSVVAGALVLPLGVTIGTLAQQPRALGTLLVLSPCLAFTGALLGYLTGAVVAGVFLVLDRWNAPHRSEPEEPPIQAELVDE